MTTASFYKSGFDLNQIRAGLRQINPPFSNPDKLKLLGDGFSSYVILVADEIIIRIAKNAQAMAGHKKERAILPRLRAYLPFHVLSSL